MAARTLYVCPFCHRTVVELEDPPPPQREDVDTFVRDRERERLLVETLLAAHLRDYHPLRARFNRRLRAALRL